MIAGFHGFLSHGHLRSRTCSRTRIWSAASETKIAMSESHWGTPGNVYQLIIKKYAFNLWRKGSFNFVSPMFLWHDQHVYSYWPCTYPSRNHPNCSTNRPRSLIFQDGTTKSHRLEPRNHTCLRVHFNTYLTRLCSHLKKMFSGSKPYSLSMEISIPRRMQT